MTSASAQSRIPRNSSSFSRGRLADHRKDAVAIKCARDPFIERSLTSTDPDLKDIAECIVLGEAELTVAFSKIERALVALKEARGNAGTFETLRFYRERVGNALVELRHIDQTTGTQDRSSIENGNPKMPDQAAPGAKGASEPIFDVREMPSPVSGGWETINDIKYQAIRHELDAGSGAVTFYGGSILNELDGDRDEKFVAFGRRLGEVQVRGSGASPIWRVEPKKPDGSHKSYSESNDVAPFHTDASYYPNPMKYLVFLAVRPAKIGGENRVFSIPDRLTEFAGSAAGRAAIEVLKRETFPFSMSPRFHNTDEQEDLPLECGPVLLDDGSVRFQIKALREGFRRRPDLASPEKIKAVEALNDFIQQHLNGRGVRLGRGQILIVNNWRTLHSRKAFTDPNHLLLRLSIADTFPTNTDHR